jgi:hypothetical protein
MTSNSRDTSGGADGAAQPKNPDVGAVECSALLGRFTLNPMTDLCPLVIQVQSRYHPEPDDKSFPETFCNRKSTFFEFLLPKFLIFQIGNEHASCANFGLPHGGRIYAIKLFGQILLGLVFSYYRFRPNVQAHSQPQGA